MESLYHVSENNERKNSREKQFRDLQNAAREINKAEIKAVSEELVLRRVIYGLVCKQNDDRVVDGSEMA